MGSKASPFLLVCTLLNCFHRAQGMWWNPVHCIGQPHGGHGYMVFARPFVQRIEQENRRGLGLQHRWGGFWELPEITGEGVSDKGLRSCFFQEEPKHKWVEVKKHSPGILRYSSFVSTTYSVPKPICGIHWFTGDICQHAVLKQLKLCPEIRNTIISVVIEEQLFPCWQQVILAFFRGWNNEYI